jgi:hypothetical protein
MEEDKRRSNISRGDTNEQVGSFWDAHDLTDFDTDVPDVEFDVTCAVPIEIELFAAIEQEERQRGVKVETLVNLWLQQELAEQGKPAAI